MITSRRADDFQRVVEGGASTAAPSAYAELLEIVGDLRALPAPTLRPEFVSDLRGRLLAEAATVLVAPGPADARLHLRQISPRVKRRNRRVATAVSGLALAGTAAALAVSSQASLPGEHLYPIKRSIESARVQLTFNEAAQGRVLLSNAGTRLDEIQQLSARGDRGDEVPSTLTAFSDEATRGADLLVNDYLVTGNQSSITTLRTFTASSMTRLSRMQSALPGASLDQFLHAAQVLDQIDQVTTERCPTCAGPQLTQVPTVLTSSLEATGLLPAVQDPTSPPTKGHQGGKQGHSGNGPDLPDLGTGELPPGSVTDTGPGSPTDGTDPQQTKEQAQQNLQQAQTTITDLTGTLTDGPQSTTDDVSQTTTNLLDAVGQAGDDLSTTVGTTVSGLESAIPTVPSISLPTQLPSLP